MNNQKAILRVVREEAYFLQSSQATPTGSGTGVLVTTTITPLVVPVGIVLDIQPQVAEDGMITLAVNPSVSEVVTTRSFSVAGQGGGASATLPVVDRRDLDTVVRMRNGETLVMAGIIKNKEGFDDRGVPWLRRIPLLGNLFTKREKTRQHTELAIFITPTLVEDPAQVKAQTERSQQRLEQSGADLDPQPTAVLPIKVP
jgi:type II secretory pathway component GspD/PulD (secretin)